MTDSYSLEAQETNVPTPPHLSACATDDVQIAADVAFRHSGWQPTRQRIREALDRLDAAPSRLAAWDACGADAWVLQSVESPERLKIASCTCHDRFCIPCADDRSARIGRRVRDKIGSERISFLTLTLADDDLDLRRLLDKLMRSFRRLRQWPLWKREVDGGVAFIEIKWSDAKQRWHPHIHAILEAGYMPQASIADRWREITATSFIVHIKRPRDSETVVRYLTRYGSKPLDQSFVDDPRRLDEALAALKGRHLCFAFAEWRGWCLTDDDEHERWAPIDTLIHLLARAKRGDPEAIHIMERLECMTPLETTIAPHPRPPPANVPFEATSAWTAQPTAWAAELRCCPTLGT